jgi:hypothetical protein
MRSEHLGRPLGSDHRADSVSVRGGDVSAAWAIAFVVAVLLGLLSPFL